MRISDWSSDVCSSDLDFDVEGDEAFLPKNSTSQLGVFTLQQLEAGPIKAEAGLRYERTSVASHLAAGDLRFFDGARRFSAVRSEEHTSELQSLMRTSYAVFCLQRKNTRLRVS